MYPANITLLFQILRKSRENFHPLPHKDPKTIHPPAERLGRFHRPLRHRRELASAQTETCAAGGADVIYCAAASIFIKNSLNDVMNYYYFCPVMRM